MLKRNTIALLLGLSLAAGIAGCGGGSGSDDSGDTGDSPNDQTAQTISGTAAQGAPLANATVTVRCVNDDSDPTLTTETDESGAFETDGIDEESFPCGLKADDPNSDDAYYSLAQQSGRTNVTPYTDMVVAIGASKEPVQWFDSLKEDGVILDETRIDNAVNVVNEGLTRLGLPVSDKDPMNAEFEIGDDYDLSMDRFIAGVAGTNTLEGYSSLRTLLTDGNVGIDNLVSSVPDEAPDEAPNQAPDDGTDSPEDGTDSPDDGTDSPDQSTSYAQCWNEDLYTPGHERVTKIEQTAAGETYRTTVSVTVEDRPGSEVAVTEEYVPDDPDRPSFETTAITDTDFDTPQVWTKRSVDENTAVTYDPARVTDYSLEPGESTTQSFDVVPDDDSRPTNSIDSTETFIGVETITLPSGETTEACRIDRTQTSSETGSANSTSWFEVGTGLLLRNQVDGETTLELIDRSP